MVPCFLLSLLLLPSFYSSDLPSGFHLDIDGISIAPSNSYLCALERRPGVPVGGKVQCWGDESTPQVSDVPSDSVFVQVVTSTYFACGVLLDQRVSCWGERSGGKVKGLFSQISAGSSYACGVLTDGHITCWGKGYARHSLNDDARFVQVSCGNSHCCGLDDEGLVHCWGSRVSSITETPKVKVKNDDGDLINAETRDVVDPDELEDFQKDAFFVTEDVQFKQISVGDEMSCGIQLLDGDIRCWGNLRSHKLSDSLLKGPYRQVSVGWSGLCGILESNNKLNCYGRAAIRVGDQADSYEWDQVRVGKYNVCGVTMDSQLKCFGISEYSAISNDFVVA